MKKGSFVSSAVEFLTDQLPSLLQYKKSEQSDFLAFPIGLHLADDPTLFSAKDDDGNDDQHYMEQIVIQLHSRLGIIDNLAVQDTPEPPSMTLGNGDKTIEKIYQQLVFQRSRELKTVEEILCEALTELKGYPTEYSLLLTAGLGELIHSNYPDFYRILNQELLTPTVWGTRYLTAVHREFSANVFELLEEENAIEPNFAGNLKSQFLHIQAALESGHEAIASSSTSSLISVYELSGTVLKLLLQNTRATKNFFYCTEMISNLQLPLSVAIKSVSCRSRSAGGPLRYLLRLSSKMV